LTPVRGIALSLPVDAGIKVEPDGDGRFRVTIRERSKQTTHQVTVSPAYLQQLTGGRISAEALVRMSFEFLLEREPKESILRSFDLPVISRYFPDYEPEMTRRLLASLS
jgi:hypothetical protein